MSLETKAILWLASLAIVAGALFGVYRYGRHVEGLEQAVERDKAVQEQQEKNRLALLAYAKTITDAGVQHDQDQIIVNRLATDLQRVRIHIPTCTVPGAAQASADSSGGTGLLPDTVDDAFAILQAGIDRIVTRCAQLNIDARRANASAQ